MQTHPDEDQRFRASGLSAITADTELEPAPAASRPLPFCPLLREAGIPFPSQQGPQDSILPQGRPIPPALDRAGSRCGLRSAPWAYAQPERGLCSLKGPEQRRRSRRRRRLQRAEDVGLGTKLDGAPRAGGPPPGPPSRVSPRRSAKFRVGPPEGARGGGGAAAGSPARAAAGRSRPAGLRLRSEGRLRGRGIRTHGVGRSVEPDSGGVNAPGFGVERSQAPGQLGCRPPGPSPRPPYPPPPAPGRDGAAPGSRVGRVSGPWASAAPGRGEDT